MKVLLFTDQHIHDWRSFGINKETGLSRRLHDQLKVNDQIVNIAQEEKPGVIVCGGDVYHSRVNIPVVAMNFVDRFFIQLKKIALVYLVRGNHDLVSDSDYKTHYDALAPIAATPQKEVVCDGVKFRFVDYYEDVSADDIKGYDVVVLHKQPSMIGKDGFKFEGLDHRKLAKNNRFVFFGHYHTKTIFGGKNANCVVMGSVMPLTFGDSGEHGVWILDTSTWELVFKKLDYPEFITVDTPDEVQDDDNYYRVLHAIKNSDRDNVVNVIVPEYFEERITSLDFNTILAEWVKIQDKDDSYIQLLNSVIGTQQVETEKDLFKGRILNVVIEDFMSIGKIDLDIQNGFTLVTGQNDLGGSNGSGKSSIFDAIYWCLFGETTKGLTGDAVIHRDREVNNCTVTVNLVCGDTQYCIQRSRKHGLVIEDGQVDEAGNEIDIVVGMKEKQKQEILEKQILGFNKTLFLTSCYFSQEQLQTITDLSDGERTNMVTKLLGFDIYDKMYDIVKDKIDTLKDDLTDIDSEIGIKTNLLDQTDIEVKGVEEKIELVMESIRGKKTFIKETNEEIESIKDITIDFDAKLREIAEHESILSEQGEKDSGKLKVINTELMDLNHRLGGLKTERHLNDENVLRIENKISRMREQNFGDRCDFCGSLIVEANIDAYESMKAEEMNKYLGNVKAAELAANELEKEKQLLSSKVDVIQARVVTNNEKFLGFRNQIETLNADKLDRQKRDILSETVDRVFGEITELREMVDQYKIQRKEVIDRIDVIKVEIGVLKFKTTDINFDIEKLGFWKKAFSPVGIKSLLLDKFCNEYNQISNEYISTISTGSMSIVISPTKLLKSGEERNKIGIDVKFNGHTVAYESLSGGEKKRVDIALCLSLNKWVALRYNLPNGLLGIIALDEIFAFLDVLGEETIGTLLYKEGQEKAVYVISHTNELSSYANKYLTVVKKDNISSLLGGKDNESSKKES